MATSHKRALLIGIGADRLTDGLVHDLRTNGSFSYVAGVIDEHQNHAPFDHVVAYFSQCLFADYNWQTTSRPPVDDALYRSISQAEGNLLRQMDRLLYEPLATKRVSAYTGTFDERRSLFFDHLRFWDWQLRSLSIDVVIFHNVPHQVFDTMIYHLAQARSIPTLIFSSYLGFRDSLFVSETIDEFGLLGIGTTIHLAQLGKWRDSTNRVMQDWRRVCQEVDGKQLDQPPTRKYSLVASIANDGRSRGQTLSPALIGHALVRKLNRLFSSRAVSPNSPRQKLSRIRSVRRTRVEEQSAARHSIPSGRFIYFPLHFQPEASTSARGRHFVEQEEIVNSLVAYLPNDVSLVLKEHPHQFARLLPRPRYFYSRLVTKRNVVLVSSDIPSVELRRRCLAVVTVSGSNGFEVLASGKPVIAFGSAPWREAPGVHIVRSNQDVKRAIDEVLTAKSLPRDEYTDFLERLRNATFQGDLSGPTGGRPEPELAELAAATRHNVGLIITTWLNL